ncbi:MAG: choice-of-anchor D domain-containing protein [Actinomycetota bacterium]|nr:choice-of-anchor D domain-containing protein [Actinomycetota bacterium]
MIKVLPTMVLLIVTSIVTPAEQVPQAAAAGTDAMFVQGEDGTWVTFGSYYSFIHPTFQRSWHGTNGVIVGADEGGHDFTVWLRAADGAPLTVGVYENAERDPFNSAGHPGMSVSGDSAGCNIVSGRFIIDDIAFDASGVATRLAARWEMHCEGHEPAVFGAVTVNSSATYWSRNITPRLRFGSTSIGAPTAAQDVIIANTGPSPLHVTEAQLTGPNAASFEVVSDPCTGVDIAVGGTCRVTVRYNPVSVGTHTARLTVFDDVAPNTGLGTGQDTVLDGSAASVSMKLFMDGEAGNASPGPMHLLSTSFTFDSSSAGITASGSASGVEFSLHLLAPLGQPLATGVYEGAARLPSADTPGIDLTADGLGCASATGRFIVDDLVMRPNGSIITFAARWEYHCDGAETASFGAVAFNSAISYPERTLSVRILDFDQVTRGVSSTVPVTVSNLGPAPLHFGTAAIGGNDAGDFAIVGNNCTGTTVASGATCTLQVRFLADGAYGDRTARLTFFDDIAPAGGGGTGQDVLLWGTVSSAYGEFVPLTPSRILDTREGNGAPLRPIPAGSVIDVQVTGRGGVPATGVSSVVLNVTAVNATTETFITLWPTGGERPTVSNLNPAPGPPIPNQATIQMGAGGKISAYNHNGRVDLIFDVVGYYSDEEGVPGSRFHAVGPFRMIDTRYGTGPLPIAPIGPRQTLPFDVRGAGGEVPSDVTAVVMNVTFVNPTAPGFVTVYPGDVPLPTTSSLNTSPGAVRPNLVTVRVPPSGIVNFFNFQGSTDLVVDVVGYYDTTRVGDAGRFQPVTPFRAWDTRDSDVPLDSNEVWSFPIGDFGGAAPFASAAVLNVTAVSPTASGFLTVYSDDLCDPPLASNLNFVAGQTVPNGVIAQLSLGTECALGDGRIDVYNLSGKTHVILDVVGYFMT